jgi:hypothetical protein
VYARWHTSWLNLEVALQIVAETFMQTNSKTQFTFCKKIWLRGRLNYPRFEILLKLHHNSQVVYDIIDVCHGTTSLAVLARLPSGNPTASHLSFYSLDFDFLAVEHSSCQRSLDPSFREDIHEMSSISCSTTRDDRNSDSV